MHDPGDMPILYGLDTAGETGERGRCLIPSVVERASDRSLVGLVCAYNANRRDGFAYLAAVCAVPFTPTGLCAESLLLLAEDVFSKWGVRNAYLEAPVFNYEQFASGAGRFFTEEARLQDHTYYDGRYWDLIVGSLTRAGMEAIVDLRRRRRTSSPGDKLYLPAAAVPLPV